MADKEFFDDDFWNTAKPCFDFGDLVGEKSSEACHSTQKQIKTIMADSDSSGYQHSSFLGGSESNSEGYAEFSKLFETISTDIQKVSSSVASMTKMVNQIGTPQDCESSRSQLHQVQDYTNQLVKDTYHHLKELQLIPNPPSTSEQKQRKMLKDRLTNQFTDALKNFQTAQRNASQKERESVMRARAQSGLTGGDYRSANSEKRQGISSIWMGTDIKSFRASAFHSTSNTQSDEEKSAEDNRMNKVTEQLDKILDVLKQTQREVELIDDSGSRKIDGIDSSVSIIEEKLECMTNILGSIKEQNEEMKANQEQIIELSKKQVRLLAVIGKVTNPDF